MSTTGDGGHPLEAIAGVAGRDEGSEQPDQTVAAGGTASGTTLGPDDDVPPLGLPGPPISRHSAFYRGFWGALGAVLAIVLVLAIRQASTAITLVVVSIVLAVGLNPLVELLQHRARLPRRIAVLLVTLGVLGVVALFVVSLVPVLRDQINALITNGPGYLDTLRRNHTVRLLDERYHIISKISDKLQDPALAQRVFGSLYDVGLAVLGALLNAFIVFVLTLYFLISLKSIKAACYSLAPASRRERVSRIGDAILRGVGGYVSGVFVVSLCAGTTSFIFLQIVGLGRYALALALVVALLDLVPLIGATIGAVIVTLIGFGDSVPVGIACIVFYVVYQQIENYVIYPRVMRSTVDVPGVVTVIAVLVGGALMGVVGAMLAIPIAAAILLLVREVVLPRQEAS